jgi:hypothetical protein
MASQEVSLPDSHVVVLKGSPDDDGDRPTASQDIEKGTTSVLVRYTIVDTKNIVNLLDSQRDHSFVHSSTLDNERYHTSPVDDESLVPGLDFSNKTDPPFSQSSRRIVGYHLAYQEDHSSSEEDHNVDLTDH